MSTPIYTSNYRRNLKLYWRQYFPNYKIPMGYHVHHIKPRYTFEDKDDPAINHPNNLIALHPDDHISIHKCRGDQFNTNSGFMNMRNYTHSDETKQKIGNKHKGKQWSNESKEKLSKSCQGRIPWNKGKKDTFTHSKESKNKISNSLLGNTNGKGKSLSLEHKNKISERLKGKSSWNKGMKWFNNGTVSKLFRPGTEPSNFILGRLS